MAATENILMRAVAAGGDPLSGTIVSLQLNAAETTVIHDYIESGTFVILGALTATPSIEIRHARINDLRFFLTKC